jgi:hypothetical protein
MSQMMKFVTSSKARAMQPMISGKQQTHTAEYLEH